MSNVSQSEPALTTGTITSLVAAAVALVVAFGLSLDDKQVIAITGFVAVVAPLVSGFVTRRQVTPSSEVVAQVSPSGDFVAGDALTSVPNGEVVNVDSLVKPRGDVHITVTGTTEGFAEAVRAELDKDPRV